MAGTDVKFLPSFPEKPFDYLGVRVMLNNVFLSDHIRRFMEI